MAQIRELQGKLAALRGDVRKELRADLREGMSDEDIKAIQELLASDSEIYPEGLVTGYFGQLTKRALMRLQHRHGIHETGEIDQDTKDLLEEYLQNRFGERVPPGLLRAPGIMKRVEQNLCDNSGHGHKAGPLCKKFKELNKGDDDDDEDANDDEDDDEDANDDSDDEDSDDDDSTAEADAQSAIDDAQSEIDDVQALVDVADDGSAKDDAQALLDDANDKLDDAQTAFDADDWTEAEDLAKDAEDLANDAEEALNA
jgi:hypothetical protein